MYEELSEEIRRQMKELGRLLDEYPEEYDIDGFEDSREGLSEPWNQSIPDTAVSMIKCV